MNQDEQISRIIWDLFFYNSEQIRLIKQFVSYYVYKTDTIFNTNERHMLLSILVGILNWSKIFPFEYCYITLESASIFEFIKI